MGWGPDKAGINGVFLRKDVPIQAAKALEACMRTVTPRIMTWQQYAEAAANVFEQRVLGRRVPDYVPDFTRCVDHFALHAGGYAVLKGLKSAMRLPVDKMLPSFATLRDYGNTSCSTTWCARKREMGGNGDSQRALCSFAGYAGACFRERLQGCALQWGSRPRPRPYPQPRARTPGESLPSTPLRHCRYVMAYLETCDDIRRGQTIMQIGMGGGMKVRTGGGAEVAWARARSAGAACGAFLLKS